jgi:hypothetical protein
MLDRMGGISVPIEGVCGWRSPPAFRPVPIGRPDVTRQWSGPEGLPVGFVLVDLPGFGEAAVADMEDDHDVEV